MPPERRETSSPVFKNPFHDYVYDARRFTVWDEAEKYAGAGFPMVGALKEARKQICDGK
jgi:hypothetical protein